MARNDGLILLLLGIGAYFLTRKGKAPILNGRMLSTRTMTPYPVYYYRDIELPFEDFTPEQESRYIASWKAHVTRDPFIPSTTPGYHPEFQSIAIEHAHKTMPMTLRKSPGITDYVTRSISGHTVETMNPEAPETQAMVEAYKEYAKSRKTSTSGTQTERKTLVAGGRRARR